MSRRTVFIFIFSALFWFGGVRTTEGIENARNNGIVIIRDQRGIPQNGEIISTEIEEKEKKEEEEEKAETLEQRHRAREGIRDEKYRVRGEKKAVRKQTVGEHQNGALQKKMAEITEPVGFVLMVKGGTDGGTQALEWLGKHMDSIKDEARSRDINIEIKDVSEQFKMPLEQLLEVEGVEICVPGTDYAISRTYNIEPDRHYDVAEELFTIDRIILKKSAREEFKIHVPASAKEDFENRILRLTDKKGADGRTISQKVEEGDVKVLAMILAEWARYEACDFSFDEVSEDKIARAVIRIVGVGYRSPEVRMVDEAMENEQSMAVILENEIRNIVGDDQEAWERIMDFMYPGAQSGTPGQLRLGNNYKR